MIVKELRSCLEKLLEKVMRKKLTYVDFLRLLATYSHPAEADSVDFHNILILIRRLSDEVVKAHGTLHLMKREVMGLVKNGYRPFLVDCFGLPEVYKVYAKITEEHGPLAVSVKPYINASAFTLNFGRVYGSSKMVDLARELGTSLYKSTDKSVHEELGKFMSLTSLLSLAKLKLESVAESLTEDVVRAKRAIIISDHGYDVYFESPDKYRLGHGHESRLAKIAPLIIVEC
jgi:hypothetical protein